MHGLVLLLCDLVQRYFFLIPFYPLPAYVTASSPTITQQKCLRPSKHQISGLLKILKGQLKRGWTVWFSNPSMGKGFSLSQNRPCSSVGIATRYWLDGPGIEFRWGARFSPPVQTDSESHPDSYTMGTGSFLGVKRPGRDFDHPPPCSVEVKERVKPYLYSISENSWPVIG